MNSNFSKCPLLHCHVVLAAPKGKFRSELYQNTPILPTIFIANSELHPAQKKEKKEQKSGKWRENPMFPYRAILHNMSHFNFSRLLAFWNADG